MKILIIGRTATGKEDLKKLLVETYGWRFPAWGPFSSPTPDKERVATTKDGRFLTRTAVKDADAIIIGPDAAYALMKDMPEESFRIVHMIPSDPDVRKEIAIGRAGDPAEGEKAFDAACAKEDSEYAAFEERISADEFGYANFTSFMQFANTYKESDLEALAISLELSRRFARNATAVLKALVDGDVINHDDRGTPVNVQEDGTKVPIRTDLLVEYLEQDPAMLGDMLRRWLQMPGTDIAAWTASKQEDAGHD